MYFPILLSFALTLGSSIPISNNIYLTQWIVVWVKQSHQGTIVLCVWRSPLLPYWLIKYQLFYGKIYLHKRIRFDKPVKRRFFIKTAHSTYQLKYLSKCLQIVCCTNDSFLWFALLWFTLTCSEYSSCLIFAKVARIVEAPKLQPLALLYWYQFFLMELQAMT